MFGNAMRIELDGLGVTLRPIEKSETSQLATLLSNHIVTRYTNMISAPTVEGELKWFEKTAESHDTVIWGIVPDPLDTKTPVNQLKGITGLHNLSPISGSCTSGIIVGDPEYWGKGVAYRAHILRTYAAWTMFNRNTIQSHVRTPNKASLKALLKVGYFVSGKAYRDSFVDGKYLDTYSLTCFNPLRVSALYPEGFPNDETPELLEEMKQSLERGKRTIELAETCMKFV